MEIWYRLGHVGNRALNLHYSWLLALTLGIWTLIHSWIPARVPEASGLGLVLLALLISFLGLLSVLGHAVAQLYATRMMDKQVGGGGVVNLGLFGIAAPLLEGGAIASRSALAVLAGPLFSGLVALLCNLLATALSANLVLSAIFGALALINAFLAIFNLIPALPLDGAAMLQAVLPGVAAFTGVMTTLLAIGLIVAGAWVGFVNNDIDLALWLIFIGWTVRELAASVGRRQALRGTLRGVAASEIMERNFTTVQASDTLEQIMAQRDLRSMMQLPVLDGNKLVGILPVDVVEESLQGTWPTTTARDAMLARQAISTLPPDASLLEALDLLPAAGGDLSTGSLNAAGKPRQIILPVVERDELRGVLTSQRLAGFAGVQQTFGVSDSPILADPPSGRLLGLTLLGLLVIAFVAAASVKPGSQGTAIEDESLLPTPTAQPAVGAAARYLWPDQLAADLKLDAANSKGSPATVVQSNGDWSYNLTYHDSNRSFRIIGGNNITVPTVGGSVKQMTVHNNPARLNRNTNRISLRWGESGGTVAITSLGMSEQEVISIAMGTVPLTPREWNNRLTGDTAPAELPTAAIPPTAVSLPAPTSVPTLSPSEVRYMFPAVVAADVKLIKDASYADPLTDTQATHWSYKLVYHDSSRSFELRGGSELTLATAGGAISEVTVHGNTARLEIKGNRTSVQWGEGGGVVTIMALGMDKTEVMSIAEGTTPLLPAEFVTRIQP